MQDKDPQDSSAATPCNVLFAKSGQDGFYLPCFMLPVGGTVHLRELKCHVKVITRSAEIGGSDGRFAVGGIHEYPSKKGK